MKKDKKFVISEIIKRGMVKEQKKVATAEAEKKVNGQLKIKQNENNIKHQNSS